MASARSRKGSPNSSPSSAKKAASPRAKLSPKPTPKADPGGNPGLGVGRKAATKPATPRPSSSDPFAATREGISAIDSKLVELLNARAELVMEVGRIVLEDHAEALLANPEVRNAYLGG